MRIDSNKIMFEEVTCWDCEGSGRVQRYAPCVNQGKKMYGKRCECGSRSRHGHFHSKTPHYVVCSVCGGKGTRMEDKYDWITAKVMQYILSHANFIFRGNLQGHVDLDKLFIQQCYSPINSFAGAQDYVDHRNDDAESLLKIVKAAAQKRLLQACNYVDDSGKLILNILYFGYLGGYQASFIMKGD